MFTAPLQKVTHESSYYRGLFDSLNADKQGFVATEKLAEFLKTSGLPDETLHQIWELVDVTESGRFNFELFCRACRVIGHAQQRTPLAAELLYTEPTKLPVFHSLQMQGALPSGADEQSYKTLFNKLRVGSIIPPEAARGIFLKSGVQEKDLARIFDLATSDTQGVMGYGEFLVAMTLITRRRQGLDIPLTLPPDLVALAHQPTPLADATEVQRREQMITELENDRRIQLTQKIMKNDAEYYIKFDEMKKLETALSVAQALTGSWQDQILVCQGRLGEIQTELDDMQIPAELPEDVTRLEHDLQELQTELEKVQRTKADYRARVQVLRERVHQRSRDTDLISTTLSSNNAKLSDLRKERVNIIEATNSIVLTSTLIPNLQSSASLNSTTALRRDAKGVRAVAAPQSAAPVLVRANEPSPVGWETFGSEQANVFSPFEC
jgi:Ca2+-binding EF-hand superfamily protein